MNLYYIKGQIINLLALLTVVCAGVDAHAMKVHNFGVSSGLANGYVRAMAQDHDGYVWVATNDGLSRFDGHGFKNFNKDNSGLSGNELNGLAVCAADPYRMYIATQRSGLARYDCRTGLIEPVENDSLLSKDITSVTPAADGGLWLTHYHFGVQYFNPVTGAMRDYDVNTLPGLPGRVWTMAEGADGVLFVGHVGNGLSVIDTKTNTLKNYTHNGADPSTLPGDDVYSISIDPGGSVWLGTDKGAALFNPETDSFIRFEHNPDNPASIASGKVWDIYRMADGELWFGTSQGGVSVLNPKSYTYSDISKADFRTLPVGGAPDGLTSPYVYTIYQDSFGNIWIGHYRAGVDVIGHLDPIFERMEYLSAGPRHSYYLPVWNCVADADGGVWMGSENELIKARDGKLKRYQLPGNKEGVRTFIYDLALDRDGKVWVATSERGAFFYNPDTDKFTDVSSMLPVDVRTFFADPDGRLVIGTVNGIYIYENGTISEAANINSQLEDRIVQTVAMDRRGRMWIGTFGKGVSVFDPRGNKIADFNLDTGFPSNAVNALMCDSRGLMWVATRDGLLYFPDAAHPEKFTEINVLKRAGITHVMAIEEDDAHNIWVSTNKGIAHYNVKTEELSFYHDTNEIPLNTFFERGSAVGNDGRIYFASNNGLISLNPKSIEATIAEPAIALTAFTVLTERKKKETEVDVHPASDKIKLPYDQNTFRITFNVLDHAMAQRTDFAYNMEGVDDVWTETSGENVALYRNLPPGKYNFRVRQRHKGTNWSEPKTILRLEIAPPYYLTWWAKTIYAIVALLLIFMIARSYKRRVEMKQRLAGEVADNANRQQLNEERLRFYTNITHELRTPLTLILGPLEDLVSDPAMPKQYSYKLQMIRDSSNSLLGLINGILEFRKTETQNRRLMVKKGLLSNYIREIGLRFKELNRNPDVEFIMDIEGNDEPFYFDSEMITIILNNLLSNAVKYTSKGCITLSYHTVTDAEGVRHSNIKVEDTGYGIAKEGLEHIFDRYYQVNGAHQASGTGIGLALVKSLADLHQATIEVESEEGRGSTFTLSLLTDNIYPEALHGVEDMSKKNAEPQTDAEAATDRRLKLLVVEDNVDIREYITRTLSDDFEVLTAKNGLEGLHAVQTKHPDIVISDIMMPEMDGIEMCRAIKEDILTSHIPVILLTAKDSLRDKEEGYESGADSYLTKPFSAKLLVNRINNLLRARRRIAAALLSEAKSVINQGSDEPSKEPMEENEDVSQTLNSLDREFIDKIRAIIDENLSYEELGVAFLADKMCMSSSTLYRKIMAIVGVSTNEYIRRVRLGRAAEMLVNSGLNITDIAFQTGFGSHSSFAKAFKKEFGMTASEYVAAQKNK